MKQIIQCQLNGKPVELVIDVRQSLLEALRDHGLTGCKEGCGVGECGACTVLIDEVPVDSCITLAIRAEGREIRTIEGESVNGELSPVQQAYVDAGAVQCGFCTPGLVMKTTSYVEGLAQSAGGCCQSGSNGINRDDIRREHAGNLCRCTGYQTVVDAVEKSIQYCGSGQKPTSTTDTKLSKCRTYALTALIKDGLSQSLPSEKLLMKSQIASLSASFLTR